MGSNEQYAAIADAIPAELIASLSRLRWLMVVARGSTFQFRGDALNIVEINKVLGARYCLSGIVEMYGRELIVGIELADTLSQNVVWAERFQGKTDDVHNIRERIVADVVSALELRIPQNEAERARLRPPSSLDAWGLYHLGLQHIFRFNAADTGIAAQHFQKAIKLDPGFARAHAGLSYAHFNSVFYRCSENRGEDQVLARRYAEESMALDPLDPFVNLTLGRSEWLEGKCDSSLSWMERSITLNPNYAYGLYSHSLLSVVLCNGEQGEDSMARAMTLSPIDPASSLMAATRGFHHYLMGNDEEAVLWAKRALPTAGGHPFTLAAVAIVKSSAGKEADAKRVVADLREANPAFRQRDFFRRFDFVNSAIQYDARDSLTRLGLN